MKRTLLWSLVLGPGLLLAALVLPATVAAAGPITTATSCSGSGTVTCDLYAEAGTQTIAPATTVNIWGFATSSGGTPTAPGPAIVVNQGDTVSVTVHNNLAVATGVTFDGQSMTPDLTGIAPGAAKTYTFTASAPGTYLYEAGLLPGTQYQVSMGLYGALVVRPAGAPTQAYGDAATAFDGEALVVLSEIDPKLNGASNPAAFDLRYFTPRYQLINGAAYPTTTAITATSGQPLLLRYLNAGIQHHSMAVLGLHQVELALDGSRLPADRTVVAQTISPGESNDALITLPATTAASTKYALYDATLLLNNNGGSPFGGMLTFIDASAVPTGGDTTGPATTNTAFTKGPLPTDAGTLTATVSDVLSGNSNVTAAEYFVDATGANGTGLAMSGTFGSPTEAVSAVVPAPAGGWASGTHTLFVHGMDAFGNWGTFSSALFTVDRTGPIVSGLVLSPSSWNGSGSVTLSGTASDLTTGGSNVVAAEYFIGATGADGTGTPITISIPAQIVSLSASISSAGFISVHALDSAGNWGAFATITLSSDSTGPSTSGVTVAPNPSNGLVPVNSAYPALLVTASVTDVGSGGSAIATAEGFIDTVGASGTGFPFTAADGVFNSVTEGVSAYIPLTTIRQLSDGNHAIYVHGRDAAGNWGASSSTALVVDKTAPTISSVTLTPSTIAFGSTPVGLNVTASDATTSLTGGQYWIDGSATPPANPTAFAGLSASIPTSTLAAGTHTIYVRVQDAALNWSTVSSAALWVVLAVNDTATITANGSTTQTFDVGAPGLLANDQPSAAGRTTSIASAPIRTSGTGAGTIVVSCPAALGVAATPAIGGSTVCTNGAYRVTLNGVGNNNNQRAASKRGTFSFTYTLTFNGVTSTATVTITVN